MFKIGFLRMRELGIQDKENSNYYTKKPKCTGHASKFVSVGLFDVKPALMIYLYGVAAAFVIVTIETLHHRFKCRVE